MVQGLASNTTILYMAAFSFVMGTFFGFLSWLVKARELLSSHDKKTIRRIAITYSLLSGLVASTTSLYLVTEIGTNPILAVFAGSIAALFTKVLIQTAEKNIAKVER